MADFRKLFYALALVAMLAGLTIPASAQITAPFVCTNSTGTPPQIRFEGYTEQVGDIVLSCTGGTPTNNGTAVPQVNITILMNTNVTSRLLTNLSITTGTAWSEALLIVDEPHSNTNFARPLYNCGSGVAADNGPSGPGVCSIQSIGNPTATYDGCVTTVGPGTGNSLGVPPIFPAPTACAAGSGYGNGRPNVFQARWNQAQANALTWNGVPLDPPGSQANRTLRFTNIRVDATQFPFVSGSFTTISVVAQISISPSTAVSLIGNTPTVAIVSQGLRTSVSAINFLQCNQQNAFGPGNGFTTGTVSNNLLVSPPINYSISNNGFTMANPFGPGFVPATGSLATPKLKFTEGFNNAWKTKNVGQVLANGIIPAGAPGSYYQYNGTASYGTEFNQNVPGALYYTETGFSNSLAGAAGDPTPNPPPGGGVAPGLGNVFSDPLTGLAAGASGGAGGAGQVNAGTRLAIQLAGIPTNSIAMVPQAIPLISTASNSQTGIAVLTSTAADGSGGYAPPAGTTPSINTWITIPATSTTGGGFAVYEVLFDDPFSIETATVPVVVAYAYTSTSQPAVGVPTTAFGSYAPFYAANATPNPRLASSTGPVPRFNQTVTGLAPVTIYTIGKCACTILFPWVLSVNGFDTGIAIANTSMDNLGAAGASSANAQTGPVQFWYYGQGPGTSGAPPATQCTNNTSPGTCPGTYNLPAGNVLAYVVSTGATAPGSTTQVLDARGAGFYGYVIAQAGFQYCHAFAYLSAVNQGATGNGISEGYVGLILDQNIGGLPPRTGNPSEILGQ